MSVLHCNQLEKNLSGTLPLPTDQQLALNIDVDIFKIGNVQDRVDVIRRRLENDLAMTATSFEGCSDCRHIVGLVGTACFDAASLAALGLACISLQSEQYNREKLDDSHGDRCSWFCYDSAL